MEIRKIIIMFGIYSIIGWIGEVIYCYIYDKKFTNRGFLFGPFCPIYAFGALFIVFMLSKYKNNPFLIFSFGLIGCSIIEFTTSFLMEKIFNAKWWDYSKYNFHISGRICLINSLIFGIGSIIIIYLIQPMIDSIIESFDFIHLNILSTVFIIYFIIDYILSFYFSLKFKILKNKKNIKNKDEKILNYFKQKNIN